MVGLSGGLFAAGAFALGVLTTRLFRRMRPSAHRREPAPQESATIRPRRPDAVSVSDLRDSALKSWMAEKAARDTAVLQTLLADVRDVLGAEEAVFWRWNEQRDALTPELWSTE